MFKWKVIFLLFALTLYSCGREDSAESKKRYRNNNAELEDVTHVFLSMFQLVLDENQEILEELYERAEEHDRIIFEYDEAIRKAFKITKRYNQLRRSQQDQYEYLEDLKEGIVDTKKSMIFISSLVESEELKNYFTDRINQFTEMEEQIDEILEEMKDKQKADETDDIESIFWEWVETLNKKIEAEAGSEEVEGAEAEAGSEEAEGSEAQAMSEGAESSEAEAESEEVEGAESSEAEAESEEVEGAESSEAEAESEEVEGAESSEAETESEEVEGAESSEAEAESEEVEGAESSEAEAESEEVEGAEAEAGSEEAEGAEEISVLGEQKSLPSEQTIVIRLDDEEDDTQN